MSIFSLREQGDANEYVILKDKNWYAYIQMNGEMTTYHQKEVLNEFIKVLNEKEKYDEL